MINKYCICLSIFMLIMFSSSVSINCAEPTPLLIKSKAQYLEVLKFLCDEQSELVTKKYPGIKLHLINQSDSESSILLATKAFIEADLYDVAFQLQLYYNSKNYRSADMYSLIGLIYRSRPKKSSEMIAADRRDALAAFSEAIKLNPSINEGKCLWVRASLYEEMGDLSKAIDDMSQAVKINKHAALASFYAHLLGNSKQIDKAIKVNSEALSVINPDDVNSYFTYMIHGWLLSMKGAKSEAKKFFSKALSLTSNPDAVEAIKSAEIKGNRYFEDHAK